MADFIETFKPDGLRHHILIHWDDRRRRDVYARGLADLGFTFRRIGRMKVLHKMMDV